jgi:hypothetical protein
MRLALLVLVLLGLSSCGELHRYLESGPVGWRLRGEVRAKGASTIRLADLTSFDWDEVFLFEPYTPRSAVCAALAISEGDCPDAVTRESTDDAVMYIAFRQGGAFVHGEMHFRKHGDFTPVPNGPIRRTDAVFRILKSEADRCRLVLASKPDPEG